MEINFQIQETNSKSHLSFLTFLTTYAFRICINLRDAPSLYSRIVDVDIFVVHSYDDLIPDAILNVPAMLLMVEALSTFKYIS